MQLHIDPQVWDSWNHTIWHSRATFHYSL